MSPELKKKYGLFTAIAMVVGNVIGSGVFFKAEAVLKATGGNMIIGVAAWAFVGLLMIICSYSFATMATRFEKVNGVVDYAEVAAGKKYGYYMGWFMAIIYYPTLTSVLAWVSARYTCVLFGWDITGGACMTIACFYLIATYAVNTLSPLVAGKLQVTATVIKLVPLLLMAVVGTAVGLSNGMTVTNFTHVADATVSLGTSIFASVVAIAFAYEGWIAATSINSEIRDSKRNLPKALILGAFIVVAVYICYYIGLASVVPTRTLMENGQAGAKLAFQNIFGPVAGSLVFVFVIVSCLGTLNGLMMVCTRSMFALATRGEGPRPKVFHQVDNVTNMPGNSAILGLLLCAFWLLYFYGANLVDKPWFNVFSFDSSELPVVTLYAGYIPIFLMLMVRGKDLGVFTRFVMPMLAILGCVFMVVAACFSHGKSVFYYLVVFAAVMAIGALFSSKKAKAPSI